MDARASVQAATDWLIEQGLRGSDLAALVSGLGRQLRQSGLAIDRAGCALLTLHPQIMSEEAAWDASSDEPRTTLFTPQM